MRVAIIGAGPAGLFLGSALAGRGHDVVAVDRDPGRRPAIGRGPASCSSTTPTASGRRWGWRSSGSGRRRSTRGSPSAPNRSRSTCRASGRCPAGTGPAARPSNARCGRRRRRCRACRSGRGTWTASSPRRAGSRGIVVDGSPVEADLVVDASGRSGRSVDALRAPATVGGPCGMAYVDRQYRLRDGAEPGPDDQPARLAGRLRRLPGAGLPARAGALLGGPGPPDRRRGAEGPAAPGRLRGRLPGHPRPGRVDRSRTGPHR